VNNPRVIRPTEIAFLAVLVVVGAGLRVYRSDTGLWYDEIVTLLDSVRPPLLRIVTHFPSNNDHPLYSVIAHLSVSIFGTTPFALRLPAVLFGVAAIPLLYFVGRAVTGRFEAGAAALILTFSYHHIWFSQNARGYTALLFFVMLSTLALIRWFETGSRSSLVVYAVSTALGAYAHLTMVLVCLSHALAGVFDWLWYGRDSRVRAQRLEFASAFVGAGLLTIALHLPMLLDVSAFYTPGATARDQVATPVWSVLAALRGLQAGFGSVWVILVGALLFGAGVWSYFKQRPTVLLLMLLAVPFTLLVILVLQRPVRPRFVLFAIGFGLLVTLRGAATLGASLVPGAQSWLSGRQAATAMVVLFTAGALVVSLRSLPFGYEFPKQDFERAVGFVEQSKDASDVAAVVGETAAVPVLRYLGRPWPRIERENQLDELRATGGEVWVLYTFPSYIETGQPDLWAALLKRCSSVREFVGTVEGGTVTVRRCR
jgi:4-amino-4-deoxy-L-arabinose transferase-like glycosyltransferase